MTRSTRSFLAPCLAATMFAAGSAPAGTESMEIVPPTRVCEPALAAYDTHLRKSPLGMFNEGPSAAFVTCGLPGSTTSAPTLYRADMFFSNPTDADIPVTCTLVDSGPALDAPTYLTRSAVITPGAVDDAVRFIAVIAEVPGWHHASVSCALPPGIGVSMVGSAHR